MKLNGVCNSRKTWHSRWESNPDLRFRRPMFYPLNYRSYCRAMKHINRLRVKPIDSRWFRLSEKLGGWFGFRGPVDRHGLRPRDDNMVGERNNQKFNPMPLFTLQSSPFKIQSSPFIPRFTGGRFNQIKKFYVWG